MRENEPVDGSEFLEAFAKQRVFSPVSADPGDVARALSELAAAAEALVSVGAMERAAAERIVEDARDRAVRQGTFSENASPPGPVGAADEVGPFYWGDAAQRPARVPVKVIPLVADLGVYDATRVVVLAAEIWSDSIRIRFVLTLEDGVTQEPPERWMWRLEDDTGRLYEGGGATSGGGGPEWVAEQHFHPAPAAGAETLILVGRRMRPIPPSRPRSERPMTPAWGFPREELFRLEIPLR
jgi:hypothetical protein